MLKQKIQEDLNQAIKEREETTCSTLRVLLAAILNKEKEKRYKISKEEPDLKEQEFEEKSALTDEETIEVISSEVKKRKEAILELSAYGGPAGGGEKDKIKNFIKKEKAEMKVLKNYLPEQLSGEELKKLVEEAIKKTEAGEIKDMGRVMAELMPEVKGKADGSEVSRIVKELLSSKNERNH